jgi:hypothetical protein
MTLTVLCKEANIKDRRAKGCGFHFTLSISPGAPSSSLSFLIGKTATSSLTQCNGSFPHTEASRHAGSVCNE